MRTQLSQFCEEFERVIRPLLTPLNRTTEALSTASHEIPGQEILIDMNDMSHQLQLLADKVAEQQAYVLIFGPLKSGKSTLMNAVSSSYVSEVTSLPAYPCMVYVSHAERRQYTVTRYDGDSVVFTDPAALRMHVSRSHSDLAERIRKGDETNEIFDPSVHFPKAIRAVDVRVPAGNLSRSGAVLVDTPGLYSRMKFGYDRMTREFRNAAACAIFVVKSDNLFLEQVFEEFNELLELFSRIFLVVNLDTGKNDLSTDGELVPSLESEDPLRIIEAFESLVMSAPLKSAMEEGRLRIYPVDLLRAASRRLRAAKEGVDTSQLEDSEEVRGEANFDAFLQDLTDYLNSTDYLVAFLGDSLRRAKSLLGETAELCNHEAIAKLSSSVEELERAKDESRRKKRAAERLSGIEWKPAFDELRDKLGTAIKEPVRQLDERTTQAIDKAVARWFQTEASLKSLVEDDLELILTRHQKELGELVRAELEDRVSAGKAGIRVSAETAADLETTGVELSDCGVRALEAVETEGLVEEVVAPLQPSQIPVRKGFWDWILFRGATTVRKRLFGSPENPALRIPVETKSRRLGANAKEAIQRELDRYEGTFFAETLRRIHGRILSDYSGEALERLHAAFAERLSGLAGEVAELERHLTERRKVMNHLTRLQTETTAATAAIEELSSRYGKADPDVLVQPIPESDRPLPPPVSKSFTDEDATTEGADGTGGDRSEREESPAAVDESR